jgi:outer membrane protein assembly factor BamB
MKRPAVTQWIKFGGFVVGTAFSVTILSAGTGAAQDSNWPQWRGPGRNGVSTVQGLPVEWNDTKNILWKTPIEGRGHSSPVVWANRIFLTTDIQGEVIPGAQAPRHVRDGETYFHPATGDADKRHTLKVISIDADTGEILWTRTAHDGRVFDNRNRVNTYASPTTVTDGSNVYVYFGSQGVFCYDFEGKQVWKVDLGGILTWGHGHGTSPLLYENLLILQIDQNQGEGSFLVALDKATGQEVWRTPRNTRLNYSSPILVEAEGRTDLVTTHYHGVIAYDPATGKELWRVDGFLGNAVPTPVANRKMVFVASGYPDKLLRAVRIPANGEESSPTVSWEYRKGTGYVPSPLLYDGYLYLVSDKGVLTCLDPETGNVVYEGGRIPKPTSVRGSPVAWDGKILLSGQDGDLFEIQAGPIHRVLSVNSLGGTVYGSPPRRIFSASGTPRSSRRRPHNS